MAGWQKNDIPRYRCFSLGDFHDFDRCCFRFFVKHHLEKKYEFEEGSENQTIGSLLDLGLKKFHSSNANSNPPVSFLGLIKAAEMDMRSKVGKSGPKSFYGAQIPFLTPEVIGKAAKVFESYYQALDGHISKSLAPGEKFWDYILPADNPVKLWGGPDAIELAGDGVPEVVDYKYLDQRSEENLDMDLMPKVYTLLCASQLIREGYEKARFRVRLWNNPANEAFYEEFNLAGTPNLEAYFTDKIGRILRTHQLSFCEKDWCKACKNPQREEWINQLQAKGWIDPPARVVEDPWLELGSV